MAYTISAQLQQKLDHSGIRSMTSEELRERFEHFRETIRIGAQRTTAPTSTDGGLLAFPTHVPPMNGEGVRALPLGTAAIAAACGGTNWIFQKATVTALGEVALSEGFIRPIPPEQRTHTFASLVNLIASEVVNVAKEYGLMEVEKLPIAISLGFPQTNIRLDNGDIDARINKPILPKFWKITDCNGELAPEQQPSLAAMLRAELTRLGVRSVGRIVFVNDTVAVALDAQHPGKDLAVGFVFGTGTNAAMDSRTEKGLLNLEAGAAKIMPIDSALQYMIDKELVPYSSSNIEYWMGGGYLPARVAAAVEMVRESFTDPEQVKTVLLQSFNQALLSEIAEGFSPRKNEFHVGPSEYTLLKEIARRVLVEAGQCIGLMIASVVAELGVETGEWMIPYEGSLMAKAYSVQDAAQKVIRELLPNATLTPYKASGMVGIAKFAMVSSR
ncbi:MAG: hypothetical protein KIH62_000815 [Candidatus Kerfeldbacteria bacterium]|nr:hypothetical protein [Candidatus Kerfeldbacteria bacterium]